jgi:hypothetical protein
VEDEIASSKHFVCYEKVSSDMFSANANIISTRWAISKKMNDDGTWRSKARLVARGYEDKREEHSVVRFPSRFVCGSDPGSGVTGRETVDSKHLVLNNNLFARYAPYP